MCYMSVGSSVQNQRQHQNAAPIIYKGGQLQFNQRATISPVSLAGTYGDVGIER